MKNFRLVYASFYSYLLALYLLTLSSSISVAQSNDSYKNQYRYQYISLTDIPVPPGFYEFFPILIDNDGRVYGVEADVFGNRYIGIYEKGRLTFQKISSNPSDYFYLDAVNARGILGGCIQNLQTYKLQAAYFQKGKLELIPYLPGEINTCILGPFSNQAQQAHWINDSNIALIESADELNKSYRLHKLGKPTFDFKLPTSYEWIGLNNGDVVIGNIFSSALNANRGILLEKPYTRPKMLNPLPGYTDSITLAINNTGYILGRSFADNMEGYIGVWDHKGNFIPYANDKDLCCTHIFNDKNMIVATQRLPPENAKSFLIPKPGQILNLEELLVNPSEIKTNLFYVEDINTNGDMVGYGRYDFQRDIFPGFLLKRLPPRNNEH